MLFHILDMAFAGLMIACAVSDHKKRTISNRLILALLILGAVHMAYDCYMGYSIFPYVFAIPLFMLCYMCWKNGAIGGGDVKLMTAICLYMGFWQAALAFGVSFAALLLRYWLIGSAHKRRQRRRIPFAPPLALGCIVTLGINYIWMI